MVGFSEQVRLSSVRSASDGRGPGPLQLMQRVLESQNHGKSPGDLEPSKPPLCITSSRAHTPITSSHVNNASPKPRTYNVAVEGCILLFTLFSGSCFNPNSPSLYSRRAQRCHRETWSVRRARTLSSNMDTMNAAAFRDVRELGNGSSRQRPRDRRRP